MARYSAGAQGPAAAMRTQETQAAEMPPMQWNPMEESKDEQPLVDTAMDHINAMTFRYAQTDAEVARAKAFASACLAVVKPQLCNALRPHMHPDVEVSEVVNPLLDAFDQIASKRCERRERNKQSSQRHPPLRAYDRELGERPAKSGKRKCIDGAIGYVWETCLEEVLEREITYDPPLLTQMIISDRYWTERAKELQATGKTDPFDEDRIYEDQCDGEIWQSHELLGDPNYCGPTRVVGQGYGDDVDIPNGIGPAAGFSKLWIQTWTLVSRPPRGRMTMRAQFLSAVCLSSDFKIFGAKQIISGNGKTEFSLGATMRRLWTGGVLRVSPEVHGFAKFHCRVLTSVFCADGMGMGDVTGTNTSFSKAINPCNRCEDLDQRRPDKREPCSFLLCRCGDADRHKRGCPCHFRLRTHARDLARPNPTKAEMQALGRTTLEHGLYGIPGIHAAHAGPKDPMHTLQEGRTSQLGAVTLWAVVDAHWATAAQLKSRASTFDWTPGTVSGFFRPNYLPDSIFVSTKIPQPNGTWVWGPHKDIKIPGSAAGVATFTLMSLEFLRPFIPSAIMAGDEESPPWLRVWLLHRAGFCMTLRYRFTGRDLLVLEGHFLTSEKLLQGIPAYILLWIPKAHWVLHLAHDIRLWGPTRLLTTLLNEMKNARFKAGAKRSNFHNPAKSVAEFWVGQSDWELQSLPSLSASACASAEARVIVSGMASSFPDSPAVQLLLQHSCITAACQLDFLDSVKFHSVLLNRTEYVFLDKAVHSIERLVRSPSQHYAYLLEVAPCVLIDELGAYYIEPVAAGETRLLVIRNDCEMTGMWAVPGCDSKLYLVPKY
jgi:hypothetical protein